MKAQVNVHHLTRVEGHGNILVKIAGGELQEARWDVVETPRFFEVMLKGKHYTTAGILAARICGICSIAHCLASIRATEHAFDVEVPETARKLRLLAKHAETLQSHSLHLFFLAAPDFLGLPSVIPLIEQNPEVIDIARRLKGLANRFSDLIAGRTTHPVSLHVGGLGKRPDKHALLGMKDELVRSLGDLGKAADLVRTFTIPDFVRETEFVSLKGEQDYSFIGGPLVSSDGVEKPEHDYLAMTNEFVDKNNTSKWCKLSRDSFAVGPLARFNNNYAMLHQDARDLAESFGLGPVCFNPFMANVVRLIECMHVVCESIELIDELVEGGLDGKIKADFEPKAGEGVSAVEAPRGILYHHYEYDAEGRIVRANCVIPTTQNNLNIHLDLQDLIRQFATKGTSDQELELLSSMLVRSYDPCISCSVH